MKVGVAEVQPSGSLAFLKGQPYTTWDLLFESPDLSEQIESTEVQELIFFGLV